MTTDTRTEELKHRVLARKKELEARLEQMKADAQHSRHESAEKIRGKLRELESVVGEGWNDMKEATAERLNRWLRSE